MSGVAMEEAVRPARRRPHVAVSVHHQERIARLERATAPPRGIHHRDVEWGLGDRVDMNSVRAVSGHLFPFVACPPPKIPRCIGRPKNLSHHLVAASPASNPNNSIE